MTQTLTMPRRAAAPRLGLAAAALLLASTLLAPPPAHAVRNRNFRRLKKQEAPAAAPVHVLPPKPAAPPTPCETINRIFLRIDALMTEQDQRDARTVSRVDKVVQQYKEPVTGLGQSAVPCLSSIAMDPLRLEKSRLWALTFLSLIKRASVFFPVKALLLDPSTPVELRSTAASYLPLLRGVCDPPAGTEEGRCVTQEDVEAALCAALDDKLLPAPALREVLSLTSRYGCADIGPLDSWIRAFGSHPSDKEWQAAHLAILTLSKSRTAVSTRILLKLFELYPAGSRGRKLLYRALLDRKSGELVALRETASPMLSWALRAEPGPVGEVLALKTLALVQDPGTSPTFQHYLLDQNPEVVAEAAAGLAAIGDKGSVPALEALLAGLAKDPRFKASGKGDLPQEAIEKIRLAADALSGR